MTNLLDWDEEDLAVDPEAEYRMLLNGLRRTEGFGLFFVQCSLAGGGQIMQRVEADLVDQSMALLKLSSEIEDGNVFKCIQKILTVRSDIQILFIQGLELSLLDYEESKKRLGWSSEKIFSYSWHGVPPVLINLNQQRECFRDRFNTRLVFLLPLFAVKYLVHRAPDFFDWRSGVAQFNDDVDTLNLESLRTQSEGDYHQYLSWTHAQRNHRLLEIQSLLEVEGLDAQKRYNLYFKQGNLFIASTDFEAAISAYDAALDIEPDNHAVLNNKGSALGDLGRDEDAVAVYDAILVSKPDDYTVLNSKGILLCDFLGRYEEALNCFEQALALKPDDHSMLHNKGVALSYLNRYEAAISACDSALTIKPDQHKALHNKGVALDNLGRSEEAISAFEADLEIDPDEKEEIKKKGIEMCKFGGTEEA
ncbi:MAG: tetratricopeptide repeat protein, partial [Leptolyngbyaceae cyanobacterium]